MVGVNRISKELEGLSVKGSDFGSHTKKSDGIESEAEGRCEVKRMSQDLQELSQKSEEKPAYHHSQDFSDNECMPTPNLCPLVQQAAPDSLGQTPMDSGKKNPNSVSYQNSSGKKSKSRTQSNTTSGQKDYHSTIDVEIKNLELRASLDGRPIGQSDSNQKNNLILLEEGNSIGGNLSDNRSNINLDG